MAFREGSIPRTTYRYGQTRSVRGKRTNQSFRPTASGDQSWDITLGSADSAIRILVAPSPAADTDRDVFAFRLLETQVPKGPEDRGTRHTGASTDSLSATTDFRLSDTAGAVSIWFKLSDQVAVPFLVKYNTAVTRYVSCRIITTGGNYYLDVLGNFDGTDHEVRGSTALSENVLYHAVISSSGTAWSLYINGAAESLTTVSGSNNGTWFGDLTGNTLAIARNAASSVFWEGTLDELAVFNEAVSSTNAAYLYNNGRGLLFDSAKSVPGLVDYWRLSSNHVGIGNDSVGGLTLTVGSGVDNTGGILAATLGQDRAALFIGDTQGSRMAAAVALRSTDTSGSISLWFRPGSTGQEPLFASDDETANNRLEIQKTSGNFASILHRIAAGTTNEIRGGTTLTTSAWNHIVVVSSGTAWSIYLNGAAEALTTVTGSNTGDWFGDFVGTIARMGRFQAGVTSCDGRLDEIGIWSTQLTSANVTTLYNSGNGLLYDRSRQISGLVHYWSCSQNHGGLGRDRFGVADMTVTERVYDEVGITTGATVDPYINQATLGIRNDEGFIELKDDDGNITWRMDDTGMLFEEGGTIVEATDGEIIITTAGSDPDFTLQSITIANALVYDNSTPEFVFFGELGIDSTLGGRITFASNSYIVEEADGALVVRAVGTDPDITLETNTVTAALFLDQAVPEWVFFGELGIDNTLGGRITFASNSYIVEEADGAIVLRAVGTDPDITLETNTVSAALFLDQAVPEWVFFGELGIDNTAGGRVTFASNSSITEQADGEITIQAVGTDPDIVIGSNTTTHAFFHNEDEGRSYLASNAIYAQLTGGGRFAFPSTGTRFDVTATTGIMKFLAIGTNPDIQFGTTDNPIAVYWDESEKTFEVGPSTGGSEYRFSVSISAAAGRVHFNQSNTTAAIPTLLLEQDDISEEIIRVRGQAAASNITQTIVAQASVSTATIDGWLKVFITDEGNQITDQAYFLPLYTLT